MPGEEGGVPAAAIDGAAAGQAGRRVRGEPVSAPHLPHRPTPDHVPARQGVCINPSAPRVIRNLNIKTWANSERLRLRREEGLPRKCPEMQQQYNYPPAQEHQMTTLHTCRQVWLWALAPPGIQTPVILMCTS